MRCLVLAAIRVFMKTIATNICGVNCAARNTGLPATSYQASWLYGMKLSPRQAVHPALLLANKTLNGNVIPIS